MPTLPKDLGTRSMKQSCSRSAKLLPWDAMLNLCILCYKENASIFGIDSSTASMAMPLTRRFTRNEYIVVERSYNSLSSDDTLQGAIFFELLPHSPFLQRCRGWTRVCTRRIGLSLFKTNHPPVEFNSALRLCENSRFGISKPPPFSAIEMSRVDIPNELQIRLGE